jgi:hypothetical protein
MNIFFFNLGRCIVEAIWIYDNSKKTALRDAFIVMSTYFFLAFHPLSNLFILLIISGDGRLEI